MFRALTHSSAALELPTGLWNDGNHQRQAELRSLSGRDEIAWLEAPAAWSPVQRTTMLLVRCLLRLGDLASPSWERVAMLTVGDREALLLHLRRLTFGSRIACVPRCPACSEKLDLELRIDDLLLPSYAEPRPWHALTVPVENREYSLYLRLPTGADQEVIATMAGTDASQIAQTLLDRCVSQVRCGEVTLESVPAFLQPAIAAVMSQLDPQAELLINTVCPNCDAPFSSLFDTALYLGQEIENRADLIFREVHTLALHYHWSESEILEMPYRRRQRYLQLLDESFNEGRYL